jgi:transcriptional regulator with XRE-family HTH domain
MKPAPGNNPAPPARTSEPTEAINRHLGRRVKQLRAARGWSLEALAQASSVSRSMLSQIEREEANPTLAVTLRIARAFGLALGELLEMPGAASAVTVIRAQDHAYHYRSDKDCRIRTLSPLNLEKDVEFYEIRLEPGGALRSSPHFEGTREFLTVQRGRIRVESANDAEELNAGDSASYRADVPHAILNAGKTVGIVLLLVIYR